MQYECPLGGAPATAHAAVHSVYSQGWTDIDATRAAVREDGEYQAVYRDGLPTLTQRSSELAKAFSFWPGPDARTGGNVYVLCGLV